MRFIQRNEWDGEGFVLESAHATKLIDMLYSKAIGMSVEVATEAVNAVNNQGVSDVDMSSKTYVHEGELLRFDYLSTAERLFLVCEAVRYAGIELVIQDVLKQLDKAVLRRFFRRFKDYSGITVIDVFNYYQHICERS